MIYPSFARRRAFTLTELMISVALALLLLVGINQVFKTTSTTVGTSYAALEGARKQISIDNVFDRDFDAASNLGNTQQPFIIIHSTSLTQYWDANDANTDKDGNVNTVDLDGNGTEGEASVFGENVTGASDLRSGRVHRVDSVSFFGRDVNVPYRRQTGNQTGAGDTLIADESSTEAWIWYGFLWLPRNGSNPAPGQYSAGDFFTLGQGTAQLNQNNFYARDWSLGRQAILLKSVPTGSYLQDDGTNGPLASTAAASAGAWTMRDSRFDIAATTVKKERSRFTGKSGVWQSPYDFRYCAKPWADPTASDRSADLALTVPFLTRGVNQFIVEFAGDFITQDSVGTFQSAKPDGVLDFVQISTSPFLRKTRWYGFPRDVAGPIVPTNPSGGPDGAISTAYDVVPVATIAGGQQAFEKVITSSDYVCAWSPNELKDTSTTTVSTYGAAAPPTIIPGPSLIRIVLNVRDPNNRLPDGTTIEHVYNLNK